MGALGTEKFIICKEVKHLPIMDLLNAYQTLGYKCVCVCVSAALTLGDVGGMYPS